MDALINILVTASPLIKSTPSLDEDSRFLANYSSWILTLSHYSQTVNPATIARLNRLKNEITFMVENLILAIKHNHMTNVAIIRIYLNAIFDYINAYDIINYITDDINIITPKQDVDKNPDRLFVYLKIRLDNFKVHAEFNPSKPPDSFHLLTKLMIRIAGYKTNKSDIFKKIFIASLSELIHSLTIMDYIVALQLEKEKKDERLRTELLSLNKYLDCFEIRTLIHPLHIKQAKQEESITTVATTTPDMLDAAPSTFRLRAFSTASSAIVGTTTPSTTHTRPLANI